MSAPLPAGLHPAAADAVLDPARLAALAATGLVGTEPEAQFDGLTSLTTRATGAPISLVALIDSDRSFFKSAHGLPETPPGRSVSLAQSMCQHVVASGEPVVVDDARAHPVLRDNGAVTDLGAGAYLGVPVRGPSGHVLGTMCAVDVEPRAWSADDVATLLAAAAAAQAEIALRAERDARQAAERLTRLKSAFLSNMSHEIRTPLTSIIGSAEVLADEVLPESRDLTGSILSGGRRLMGMLNSVLDLAQLESGDMTPSPRPADVGARLAAAARDVEPLAAAKGLALAVEVPPGLPRLVVDPDLLDRVVSSLLGNAVKFTDQGRVDVRTRYDGDRLHVGVSDTGVGIRAEDLGHLFDEFQQVSDGDARIYEGSGPGLALARRVAALMGGEVSVESEFGVGSTFAVSVPAPVAVHTSTVAVC